MIDRYQANPPYVLNEMKLKILIQNIIFPILFVIYYMYQGYIMSKSNNQKTQRNLMKFFSSPHQYDIEYQVDGLLDFVSSFSLLIKLVRIDENELEVNYLNISRKISFYNMKTNFNEDFYQKESIVYQFVGNELVGPDLVIVDRNVKFFDGLLVKVQLFGDLSPFCAYDIVIQGDQAGFADFSFIVFVLCFIISCSTITMYSIGKVYFSTLFTKMHLTVLGLLGAVSSIPDIQSLRMITMPPFIRSIFQNILALLFKRYVCGQLLSQVISLFEYQTYLFPIFDFLLSFLGITRLFIDASIFYNIRNEHYTPGVNTSIETLYYVIFFIYSLIIVGLVYLNIKFISITSKRFSIVHSIVSLFSIISDVIFHHFYFSHKIASYPYISFVMSSMPHVIIVSVLHIILSETKNPEEISLELDLLKIYEDQITRMKHFRCNIQYLGEFYLPLPGECIHKR